MSGPEIGHGLCGDSDSTIRAFGTPGFPEGAKVLDCPRSGSSEGNGYGATQVD